MHYQLLTDILVNLESKYDDKIAIITDDIEISYRQLFSDIIFQYNYLKSCSVKSLDRIVINAGNSYCMVINLWAAQLLGAVVSIFSPEVDGDLLNDLLVDLSPSFFISENCSFGRHELLKSHKIKLIDNSINQSNQLNIHDISAFKSTYHPSFTGDSLAMIIYTSGTTRRPKGVMLTHNNMVAAIKSISKFLRLSESDVIISTLPVHFDYGLYQLFLSNYNRSTLVLEKKLLFPDLLVKKMLKYKVTVFPIVPSYVSIFLSSYNKGNLDRVNLRKITNTGERLTKNHIDMLYDFFGSVDIYSMYGLTECKRCSYVPPKYLCEKYNSIGIPMDNISMYVLNDSLDIITEPNVPGQIAVSGPTVMHGYWRNSIDTSNVLFYTNDGKKYLLTGDHGYFDEDGYFYFISRGDSVIKINAEKFNPNDYINKIIQLNGILRSYIFTSYANRIDKSIFVCIETLCDVSDLDIISKVKQLFPVNQKPLYVYTTNQFPSLENGKLNLSNLEDRVIKQWMGD